MAFPILHYKFDEASGSTFSDDRYADLDGTIDTNFGSFVTGKIGTGFKCQATGLGEVPAVSTTHARLDALGEENSKYSICAWLFSDAKQTTFSRIFEKPGTPYPMVLRQRLSDDRVLLALWDGTNNPVKRTENPAPIGEWFHVVFQVDRENKTIRSWTNANLDPEVVTDTTVGDISNTENLIWGNVSGSLDRKWNGIVDDFRIYDFLLTQTHIDFIYNNGTGRQDYGPQAGKGMPNGGMLAARKARGRAL